ncbi:MAG: hypothetical protein LUC92_02520 [Clostridiales bacterium]|nr:hypothetical protein [Clostridiales bacterium]
MRETVIGLNNTEAKRNIKDSVFTKMFGQKKYLLQLYQSLHPEDTAATADDLRTITLEPIFIKSLTNDLGFSVGDKLFILVEAQSTESVNIIFRSFMYLAHTYQEYFEETKQNLYGTKLVNAPEPELYVIYTRNARINKDVITLSDEFYGGKKTALDIKINVITDENSSGIVSQYINFTKVLDKQIKEYGYKKEAIAKTIEICKNEDVLSEFLKEHEKEVVTIMRSLFDQEKALEIYFYNVRKDAEEEGRAEGEAKGRAEGREEGKEDVVIEMIKENLEPSYINRLTKVSIERINELKTLLTNNVQLAND